MVDKPRTQHKSQVHHIQRTLRLPVQRTLLLQVHSLRTSSSLRIQQVIQLSLSRPTIRVRHQLRTTARQLPMAAHTRQPLPPHRMARRSTTMMNRALWVLQTGLEARSRTRRFATPSLERFSDIASVFRNINEYSVSSLANTEIGDHLWVYHLHM